MTKLNQNLIQQKTKLIQQDLALIAQIKEQVNQDKFMTDIKAQLQIERLLERVIGRLIDINYHFLKNQYQLLPDDYHESFIRMGQKKVVKMNLAKQLAQAAGMRNILAHEYEGIDLKLVYQATDDILTQVPAYLNQVMQQF